MVFYNAQIWDEIHESFYLFFFASISNLLNLNFSAQKKLTKAEEECQKSSDYKKKCELTKDLCLELESQIKEYEVVIERMEKVQQKLKESNEDLKTKADTSGSELIKVNKVQIF